MKRLTFLAVIAMVTVATSSGCRTCGSPFSLFNRGGDSCSTCSTTGSGSQESYVGSYGSGTIYEGDTMLPPPTNEILPGPRVMAQ
jgi:hypothetical protein